LHRAFWNTLLEFARGFHPTDLSHAQPSIDFCRWAQDVILHREGEPTAVIEPG
jgi:hypothetical protein